MLIIKLLHFFKGYLNIGISGNFLERFINICIHRNIYIWDIKTKGTKTMTAKTSIKGFKKLRDICRKTNTKARILSKRGLPFIFTRFLRRKGLSIGFLLFIFLNVWLFSRIWYIEIADISGIEKEILTQQLEKAGVRPGVPIWSINPDKIQAEMLSINPSLSWIWPEVKGTKVFVDYRIRVLKPHIININQPCNLISKNSGKITEIIVKEGRKLVEKDMWISSGQLLVSGILDSKAIGVRYVHADGEIWADTTHNLSGKYLLKPIVTKKTGRVSKKYAINFGSNTLNLPLPHNQFEKYTESLLNKPLKIGNIYLPLSLTTTSFFETFDQQIELSREQIIKEAQEYQINVLQKEIENGIIKEKNFIVTDIDENTIEVQLEALCNQQIAQKQPIEGDT